jgi:hypothetical protein
VREFAGLGAEEEPKVKISKLYQEPWKQNWLKLSPREVHFALARQGVRDLDEHNVDLQACERQLNCLSVKDFGNHPSVPGL